MAKKILIIDDEEIIIRTLSKLLESNGYEVFVTKNGQDAIVMAEEVDFDLILADIRMPGMNGVETVKNIYGKKQVGKKKKIPAIFITGYADKAIEKEANKLIPAAYIYKPFDMSDLFDKINKALCHQ